MTVNKKIWIVANVVIAPVMMGLFSYFMLAEATAMIENIENSWLFWLGLVLGYIFGITIYVEILSSRIGVSLSVMLFIIFTISIAGAAKLADL